MQYEINYLVLQSKTETLDQIRQAVKGLIESHGGKIEAEKNYLKRKLAYEIKHEGYGFYTVLRFSIEDAQALAELKRELNLDANVARYILVKASELPALDQTPASMEAPAVEEKAAVKDAVEEIIREPKTVVEQPVAAAAAPQEVPVEKKEEASTAQAEAKQPEAEKETAKEEPAKQPEKKEAAKEDGKASLEELDKKLDEILNI